MLLDGAVPSFIPPGPTIQRSIIAPLLLKGKASALVYADSGEGGKLDHYSVDILVKTASLVIDIFPLRPKRDPLSPVLENQAIIVPGAPAAAAPQPGFTTPVAKQPQPKSKEEQDAVIPMFQAMQGTDADAKIKACDSFLQKFPNSEFKPVALFFLTLSYQDKNDYDKTLVYGEFYLSLSAILARMNGGTKTEADLWSIALYASFQATEKLSFHGRAEYITGDVDEPGGFNRGALGTGSLYQDVLDNGIYAVTATAQYDLWRNVISRLEFRWDHAEHGMLFGGTSGAPSRENAFMLAGNIIYKF